MTTLNQSVSSLTDGREWDDSCVVHRSNLSSCHRMKIRASGTRRRYADEQHDEFSYSPDTAPCRPIRLLSIMTKHLIIVAYSNTLLDWLAKTRSHRCMDRLECHVGTRWWWAQWNSPCWSSFSRQVLTWANRNVECEWRYAKRRDVSNCVISGLTSLQPRYSIWNIQKPLLAESLLRANRREIFFLWISWCQRIIITSKINEDSLSLRIRLLFLSTKWSSLGLRCRHMSSVEILSQVDWLSESDRCSSSSSSDISFLRSFLPTRLYQTQVINICEWSCFEVIRSASSDSCRLPKLSKWLRRGELIPSSVCLVWERRKSIRIKGVRRFHLSLQLPWSFLFRTFLSR